MVFTAGGERLPSIKRWRVALPPNWAALSKLACAETDQPLEVTTSSLPHLSSVYWKLNCQTFVTNCALPFHFQRWPAVFLQTSLPELDLWPGLMWEPAQRTVQVHPFWLEQRGIIAALESHSTPKGNQLQEKNNILDGEQRGIQTLEPEIILEPLDSLLFLHSAFLLIKSAWIGSSKDPN